MTALSQLLNKLASIHSGFIPEEYLQNLVKLIPRYIVGWLRSASPAVASNFVIGETVQDINICWTKDMHLRYRRGLEAIIQPQIRSLGLFCQNVAVKSRTAFPRNFGVASQLEYTIPGGNLCLDGVFLRELIESYPTSANLAKMQFPATLAKTLCAFLSDLQSKATLTESSKDGFKDAFLSVLSVLFMIKSKKIASAEDTQTILDFCQYYVIHWTKKLKRMKIRFPETGLICHQTIYSIVRILTELFSVPAVNLKSLVEVSSKISQTLLEILVHQFKLDQEFNNFTQGDLSILHALLLLELQVSHIFLS